MTTSTSAVPRTEPLGIAGFVVGLAAVLLAHPVPVLGVVVGVAGVVLSAAGLRRRSAAGARGRLAVAGVVLGVTSIAAAILDGILASTAAPHLAGLLLG